MKNLDRCIDGVALGDATQIDAAGLVPTHAAAVEDLEIGPGRLRSMDRLRRHGWQEAMAHQHIRDGHIEYSPARGTQAPREPQHAMCMSINEHLLPSLCPVDP